MTNASGGGNLRLDYCAGGFNPSSGSCTGGQESLLWESNTSGTNTAIFTGNLIVEDSTSTELYTSDISSLGFGNAKAMYLPGETSSCPCQYYLCIVVALNGGGLEYYYAINDGPDPFEILTTTCPALP